MLINQNQASVQGNTTRQNINRIKKLIPRPPYFIDVKDGVRIDNQHPSWILQVKDWDKEKKPDDSKKDLLKLMKVTIKVITTEYDEDEATRITNLIMLELQS